MTLDAVAQWIGYVIIVTGGVSLAFALVAFAIWQMFEAWWRWGEHWKRLNEFIEWKRGRYPG